MYEVIRAHRVWSSLLNSVKIPLLARVLALFKVEVFLCCQLFLQLLMLVVGYWVIFNLAISGGGEKVLNINDLYFFFVFC